MVIETMRKQLSPLSLASCSRLGQPELGHHHPLRRREVQRLGLNHEHFEVERTLRAPSKKDNTDDSSSYKTYLGTSQTSRVHDGCKAGGGYIERMVEVGGPN